VADRLVTTPERAARAAERAQRKAQRLSRLRRLWADIQTFGRLVRAWARGEYRDVSRGTIVMVLAALLYLLSPIDAILDGIPLLGLIDDAAVISWVLKEVRVELDLFRAAEARAALPAMESMQQLG